MHHLRENKQAEATNQKKEKVHSIVSNNVSINDYTQEHNGVSQKKIAVNKESKHYTAIAGSPVTTENQTNIKINNRTECINHNTNYSASINSTEATCNRKKKTHGEKREIEHTKVSMGKQKNGLDTIKEMNKNKHKKGRDDKMNKSSSKKGKADENKIKTKSAMNNKHFEENRIEKMNEKEHLQKLQSYEIEGTVSNNVSKRVSVEEKKNEYIQAKETFERQIEDPYVEKVHSGRCGLSSYVCFGKNGKKRKKKRSMHVRTNGTTEKQNLEKMKNMDWLVYTIRYMDYRRLRRRFNGIRKPIPKRVVFIITLFCLMLISWKNFVTSYEEGMYIISFKVKNDIVFFIEAIFALIGIIMFAKFQTRLSLHWPIYASYIFIILAAVILLFSVNEKNESDSISEHILIIYGIVQVLLIIIVKIIIFIGPLLAEYGFFCPCTEHCCVLKKKVTAHKLNITVSRYNDLAGVCGNNLCCVCLCAYRCFYRAIRCFYNKCTGFHFKLKNGEINKAPFSHQLRYKGKSDIYGRPHGYGEWIEDHSYGEKLRGFWFHGYPVGPFISQEVGSGSLFVNTRVGFVVSFEKDLTDIRYGVSCTECSISGHFFNDFPLTYFFNPHIEKNINGRIPKNRYDIIAKDILKENYEDTLSYDLKWCFNMLKVNSGNRAEYSSNSCVISLDHATMSLRVNNYKRLTPIKRKQNTLDEIKIKLMKVPKMKRKKRIMKQSEGLKGAQQLSKESSYYVNEKRKHNFHAGMKHLESCENEGEIKQMKPICSGVFSAQDKEIQKRDSAVEARKKQGKEKKNEKKRTNVEMHMCNKHEEIANANVDEKVVRNVSRKRESVSVCKSEMFDMDQLPFNDVKENENHALPYCSNNNMNNCDSVSIPIDDGHYNSNNNDTVFIGFKKSSKKSGANFIGTFKKGNSSKLSNFTNENGMLYTTSRTNRDLVRIENDYILFDSERDSNEDTTYFPNDDAQIRKITSACFMKENLLGMRYKGDEGIKDEPYITHGKETKHVTEKKRHSNRMLEVGTQKESAVHNKYATENIDNSAPANKENKIRNFQNLKANKHHMEKGNEQMVNHMSSVQSYSIDELSYAVKPLKKKKKSDRIRSKRTRNLMGDIKKNLKESINKKVKKKSTSKLQNMKSKNSSSVKKKMNLSSKNSLLFVSPSSLNFDKLFRPKTSIKKKTDNIFESFSKKMKNFSDTFNINDTHESNISSNRAQLNKTIAQVFEEEDEWENYKQHNNQKIVVEGWKSPSLKRRLTVMPDEIVVYIHGYNVELGHGCSQLAHLVSFSKLPSYIQPFVFHWEGSMWGPFSALSYPVARKRAEVPVLGEAFKKFIQHLIDLDIKNIHIISHSCGSRLFFNGFEKCVNSGLFYNVLKDEQMEHQTEFSKKERKKMHKGKKSHSKESEKTYKEKYGSYSSASKMFSDNEEDSSCSKKKKLSGNYLNQSTQSNQSSQPKRENNNKKKIMVKTVILLNPDYSLNKFLEKDFFLLRTHCNHIVMYGDTRDQALTYSETWNREKSLGKRIFKLKLPLYKIYNYHDYLNLNQARNKLLNANYEEKYRMCDSLLFPNSTQKQRKTEKKSEDLEEKEEIKMKRKEKEHGDTYGRRQSGADRSGRDSDIHEVGEKASKTDKKREVNSFAEEYQDDFSFVTEEGAFNDLSEKHLRTVEFSDSSFRSFKTKKKWDFFNFLKKLRKGPDSSSKTRIYYNNIYNNNNNNNNAKDATYNNSNGKINNNTAITTATNTNCNTKVCDVNNNNNRGVNYYTSKNDSISSYQSGNYKNSSTKNEKIGQHCDNVINDNCMLKHEYMSSSSKNVRTVPDDVFMKTDTVYISFDKYAWLDMDVIDTTFVETNVDFLKHSFYQVKREIIDDIREVMISNVRAHERVSRLDRRRGNVFVLRVAPAGVGSLHR